MLAYKTQIAELIIRVFTGVLFLFQGYDKVFRIKMKAVTATFMEEAIHAHVPKSFVSILSYYTSFAELIGGVMLVLGLYTNYALYALGIDLVLVALAFSYIRPMWDMQYVFPRFILVATLLFLPDSCNIFSLDNIFNKV